MGRIPEVNAAQFVEVAPQAAFVFPEGLEVANRSATLVRVLFNAADLRLDFEYLNEQGRRVANNALFGARVRRIEIHDTPLRRLDLRFF